VRPFICEVMKGAETMLDVSLLSHGDHASRMLGLAKSKNAHPHRRAYLDILAL